MKGKNAPPEGEAGEKATANDEPDELIDQAAQIVRDSGKASPALLQRKLRIGHGRAVRLLDQLEQRGIVDAKPDPVPRDDRPGPMAYVITAALTVGIVWFLFFRGGGVEPESEPESELVGEFVRWEAVDDARGWAFFTVTNEGGSPAEATCSVSVFNDFGNFGVNIMSGERVGAGATISRRIAIDVDEGAFSVDEGEVTDC